MKLATFPSRPVLLVDDEEQFLLSASFTLSADGINNVSTCHDSRDVMPLLSKQDFSVIALDMNMPHVSGWELLPMIVQDFPDIPVIVITGIDEVETAVECMKSGASDFMSKPVDDARLVTSIRHAIEKREIQSENALLKQYLLSDRLEHPEAFSPIVTGSNAMRSIFQYVEAIARTSMPVLITGETGVGKELIARAIHELSGRAGEFVPLNVAGVDDTLFSDTLFGHERGAFTGADRDRKGLIERAAGGTMFLDEIGDLALESQVKLLRLLQEAKYYPIGSDVPKLSDARVIVATNRDIASMQEKDEFRKDLYYRLRTHHIHIPPLRERKEDIGLLIEHFLSKAAEALGKKRPTPPKELFTLLTTYHFPGNIRELESMIFDAVSRHESGVLSMESFKQKMGYEQPVYQTVQTAGAAVSGLELPVADDKRLLFPDQLPTLKEAEQTLIEEALRRADGNRTIAAQLLGLSRRALSNRLSRAQK
jgi:DNA-binding NtrC family response regulator